MNPNQAHSKLELVFAINFHEADATSNEIFLFLMIDLWFMGI